MTPTKRFRVGMVGSALLPVGAMHLVRTMG
jgi:hypothetical protein